MRIDGVVNRRRCVEDLQQSRKMNKAARRIERLWNRITYPQVATGVTKRVGVAAWKRTIMLPSHPNSQGFRY